jgi:cell division protein FtsB
MKRKSDTWLQHALRRSGWQPQRQVVALATLGFIIALILGALYLTQVASEATTNRRLSVLLAERDELERTNEQLRAEIARLKSVPRLQARAQELGFSIANRGQIEYMVVRGYRPPTVDTVAPIEIESESGPVYDETFAGWVREQWDLFSDWFNGVVGRS